MTTQIEYFYPRETLRRELGNIAPRTFRKYAQKLRVALTEEEFDFEPHQPEVTEKARRAFLRFYELKQKLGEKKALKKLILEGVPNDDTNIRTA